MKIAVANNLDRATGENAALAAGKWAIIYEGSVADCLVAAGGRLFVDVEDNIDINNDDDLEIIGAQLLASKKK